ncbi:hypothetical protein, partial [Microbacterium sp.]|uniref:hypothetical protein n=1 Tax=Microbacterium sp. TaxID=51671 RepID=UPI0039E403BA
VRAEPVVACTRRRAPAGWMAARAERRVASAERGTGVTDRRRSGLAGAVRRRACRAGGGRGPAHRRPLAA